MTDEQVKLLNDVKAAISHIELFMISTHSFMDYSSNLMLRRAVEREIEIIGEAVNKLLNIAPDFSLNHARRIVDTRNRIIHGYDSVDDAIVYGILRRHLPELKQEINQLLSF